MFPQGNADLIARFSKRSPLQGGEGTRTAMQSTASPVVVLSRSQAYASFGFMILVPSLIILGYMIWKTRRDARSQQAGRDATKTSTPASDDRSSMYTLKDVDLEAASVDMEKPGKVVFASSDSHAGWFPQIKVRGVDISVLRMWNHSPSKSSPSLRMSHGSDDVLSRLPSLPYSPEQTSARYPPILQEAIPSPKASKDSSNAPSSGGPTKKTPRLMSVASAFSPTISDELSITVGETVRVLEEYENDWCLAQKVGHVDAPKGIVPRSCLQERTRKPVADLPPP